MAKNLPAVQETRVRTLGQEDPLEPPHHKVNHILQQLLRAGTMTVLYTH